MTRIVLLALALAGSLAAQARYYLYDGDRVVFYGDSITDQRLYTTFVESYTLTRFPQYKFTFIHSGWGGDRVSGGGGGPVDLRLQRDVFVYKPTVVTVMLGMNDGRYRAFDQAIFDEYANGYKHIVSALKGANPSARITLIQPSPYDDVTRPPVFEGGYNEVLVRYGQFVKELAASSSVDSADMNSSVVAALEKAKSIDPAKAPDLIRDRVHPGPGGHLLMAAALLKAWNAPSIVSAAEIDFGKKSVLQSTRTKINDLKVENNGISWRQTDEALPMPLDLKDAGIALALKSSDFVDSLDRQILRVVGLPGVKYQLKIDDDEVGTFTRDELAGGLNLSTLSTPMLRQAMMVHDLTLKHNNIHFDKWRVVQVPLEKEALDGVRPAEAALDALEQELIARQRNAAQPKSHYFVLSPLAGS